MRPDRPRIGISACLLGESVRYDGGHRRHATLVEVAGRRVEWVPVCPEAEIGMGTPREPIQLIRTAAGVRLQGVTSGIDHTRAMEVYARRRVRALADAGIDGYVLKKDSPSCGKEGVAMARPEEGRSSADGVGLFASILMFALPRLPVEEEHRLDDSRAVEIFLERAVEYRRLRVRAGLA